MTDTITHDSAARASRMAGDPTSTSPRLDALSKNGVDVFRLKMFLDEFGQVLIDQVAVEAFMLLKSKAFRQIDSPAEALSEGAACLPGFMISLGREWPAFNVGRDLDTEESVLKT